MACKLKCPQCGLVLKEEGDEGKDAGGEYRIFYSYGDNLDKAIVSRNNNNTGDQTTVQCLNCMFSDVPENFDMDLIDNDPQSD